MKLQLTGPLCQPINTIQKVLDDVTLHQFTIIIAHSLSKVKGVYFVVGGRTKLSSNKANENSWLAPKRTYASFPYKELHALQSGTG